MRILELTDLYPPVIGGLERYVRLLSEAMSERGHDVAVATTATADAGPGRRQEGDVEVHRLVGWQQRLLAGRYQNAARPFHPTVPDPGMVDGIAQVLREFRPDVVHAHSWNVFSVLPLVRRFEVPLVVTAHDYGTVCAKKTLTLPDGALCDGPSLGKCIACASDHYGAVKGTALPIGLAASRSLFRRVTAFTAVSRYVADRLAPVLTPLTGRPIDVLHSFVPDGLGAAARSAERPPFLPEGEFLLFVGALSRHKGIEVLLEAHRRLGRRVPLVLIGTPSATTPAVDALAPDVVMRTDVPHSEVIAAMSRAAVTVAPSIWPDPLPMTVSEAQLCGSPVVGSSIGGIPEQILDGVTGLLVLPGDAASLAARLDELLGDPSRRATMGAAGQRWAHRFTLESLTDRTLEVLGGAMARA